MNSTVFTTFFICVQHSDFFSGEVLGQIRISFHRWIIVHVPFVRYVRNSTGIIHHGSTAPPVLFLSDGGHFENFGLLPLLKLRLKKIVLVNGGFTENDSTYGDDLLRALDLSRQKLRCSFLGLDGRDVAEDLRSKFVDKVPGGQPRSYRCEKAEFY